MKKQIRFLFLFAAMILCCGNVFAGGSSEHYFNPNIYTNGNGLVYICRQGAPTMSQYTDHGTYGSASQGTPTHAKDTKIEDYSLWAYPAHGYKFASWQYDKDFVTPKSSTGNGDQATIKSNSTDQSNPTVTNIYANFTKDNNELQVVLQRPSVGSISVKSTYYNINASNQFEETTETVTSSTTDAEETRTLIHYSSDKLVLTASDASFSGWYKVVGDTKTLLSNESSYNVGTSFTSSVTIRAEFKIANFKVGANTFENIADAISAASNGSDKTIVLLKDYTLTQNVTIPAGVTFLVPNDANYNVETTAPKAEHSFKTTIAGDVKYDRSFVFRKLTLAEGVTLTINGSLNVGGFRWCASYIGNNGDYIPETAGNFRLDQGYGLIDMAANSMIILNNSASLCCWGRIRGEGTITANSGSTVRECWVNTDYRESDAYKIIAEDLDCFPMNQYYIQDIQVATTFKAGAQEILTAGMYIIKTEDPYTGPVNWIGTSNSLFELSGDAYITKRYDVATDRIIYDLYNGVNIADAELNIMYQSMPYSFSTKNKIFDITNNCSINVHSGKTIIKTDLALAAGAELNIDSLAEVEVAEHVSLYVFDKDDWDNFACMKKIVPLFLPKYELSTTGANYYAVNGIKVDTVFSGYASYGMLRTEENLTDAKITVNGKLTVKGGSNNMDYKKKSGLYTTNAGAQIISDNSGLILFEQGIGTQTKVAQLWGAGRGENDNAQQEIMIDVVPAILQNAQGAPLETANYTGSVTFEYVDGVWGVKKTIKDIEIAVGETTVTDGDNNSTSTQNSNYTIPTGDRVEIEEDVEIKSGSSLIVEENASVDVKGTLALNTTPSYCDDDNNMGLSSQVTGKGSITAINAYIDIQMAPGKLDASKYYAFAVPFNVSAKAGAEGVQKLDKDGNVSDAKIDADYLAYVYDGAIRATSGANGSAWVAMTSDSIYKPGKFYLIEFATNAYNVFRFHKIEGDSLDHSSNIDLNIYPNAKSDDENGWCGIANNSLKNTKLEIQGVDAVQVLDSANTFTTVLLSNATFAVGTPMFAQVTSQTSATHASVTQAAPDRHIAAQISSKIYGHYTIRIAAEGASKKTDQLFIAASEDAEDSYTVGRDLTKMFIGNATVAQLWVNAYDKKLSVNQAVMVDNVAESSMTLYAPKAGNYQVYLKDIPEDATLYLLENGEPIANLNEEAFIVALDKGENKQYGLRINAKTIPGVVTAIDEAKVGGKLANKVLLNGNVYIVRDNKLFNALGQQVK